MRHHRPPIGDGERMTNFDYGEKLPDGQHERHPTDQSGEYQAPIRNSYKHLACGGVTRFGNAIAETYAKHPFNYGGTFCCRCGDYFPLRKGDGSHAFEWTGDGTPVGEKHGTPGEDQRR